MIRKGRDAGLALLIVNPIDASALRAGKRLGMRCKPLKSLKTDSAIGRVAVKTSMRSVQAAETAPAVNRSRYALGVSDKPNLSGVVFRWGSVAGGPPTGANRATGRPCRVRTTSPPASARRTRSVRRALAMLIGTFISCRISSRRWLERKS
jgi:hypothetical protein